MNDSQHAMFFIAFGSGISMSGETHVAKHFAHHFSSGLMLEDRMRMALPDPNRQQSECHPQL
jgi:hypothetical protein